MVNTRSIKEHKAKEKAVEEPTVPTREIDLETPDQIRELTGWKERQRNTNAECRRTKKEEDRVLTN